jgi:predicted transposase/invertase (TIGR01784 family)
MEEGMAKGEEVGKSQRSIEIAKNMLAKGMDEVTIQEITGLTEDQILQIQ